LHRHQIWISGVIFSGKPAEVVNAALNKKFQVVLSQVILDEIEKKVPFPISTPTISFLRLPFLDEPSISSLATKSTCYRWASHS
jgi:predicted nucleic acid-binding protein